MRQGEGKRIAVTGASGFIGRAVVRRIDRGLLGPVAELVLNDVQPVDHVTATVVRGTYADAEVRQRLVGGGVDLLFHLASLPGGASERDPALGRAVNLDASIALIDAVARADSPVVVYTSSIAALARSGSYGTHKAMIELYLADITRRGLIDGRAVRPAGIVARPPHAYAGFATAWMSDLFHAAVERRAIAIPAQPDAHVWLQSIDAVADAIIHAALMPAAGLPPQRAWTLPATAVRVDALVAAIGHRTGHALQVAYEGGPINQPPLDAGDALAVGFVGDGGMETLVDAVIKRIADQATACRA